jgi:hypothetical protein
MQRRQGTHIVQEQEQVRTKARRELNQPGKLNCQETGSKTGKRTNVREKEQAKTRNIKTLGYRNR